METALNNEKYWVSSIIYAFYELGKETSKGYRPLKDIYEKVKDIRTDLKLTKPKKIEAVIRYNIEKFSADSDNFNGKINIFQSQKIRSGMWRMDKNYHDLCPLLLKINNRSIIDVIKDIDSIIKYNKEN